MTLFLLGGLNVITLTLRVGCMLATQDYNRGVSLYPILKNPYQFVLALKAALKKPLPGVSAHKLMSPPHRISQPDPVIKSRNSAVLVLMYPTDRGIIMPFTLRLSTLAHHAGEICFPGGGVENGDSTLVDTALRETAEELGLDAESVHVLGPMTPIYVSASQNLVHPILGWMNTYPTFTPSPFEVERVIEVMVEELLNPANVGEYQISSHGQTRTVPCYRISRDYIWGATAMILSEFLLIINTHLLSSPS